MAGSGVIHGVQSVQSTLKMLSMNFSGVTEFFETCSDMQFHLFNICWYTTRELSTYTQVQYAPEFSTSI